MAAPAREELVERLHDSKPKIRRKAVRQLAVTHDPAVVPLLRTAYLGDEDPSVREDARKALAMFKAMELNGGRRPLPVSETALSRVLRILLILFVVSLVANIAWVGINGLGDDDDDSGPTTDRAALISALAERTTQAGEDLKALREEIEHHNETDEVRCEATYHRPQPYALAAADRSAYPDLADIEDLLTPALTDLQRAQTIWDTICQQQSADLIQGLEALKQLDHVSMSLDAIRDALDEALREPTATATAHPSATATQAEATVETAADTPIPAELATLEPGVTPTAAPPTATLTITPTSEPTDTPTITPTPTQTPLPYPNLDYDTILRQLSDRLVILGDLQNTYETGMIDYWNKAQAGQAVSTTFCSLPAWPTYFFWNDAQRAELERPDAADPELAQAVALINSGLDNALPARELFESSCRAQTLATTATQGLPLAEQAVSDFTEAQQLIEQIRGRR
ncbi:HEAT repeat domain-containing protein [Aggregatilinea lenta]|uniref:HEAT repeat domain-containing protein n=1 Tax=Aggregatilinea lenta TaxID=913108 RepID=UPI000E5C2055|nr:HEAT repeat domain-containing protein [Aggregatilinea lenta]